MWTSNSIKFSVGKATIDKLFLKGPARNYGRLFRDSGQQEFRLFIVTQKGSILKGLDASLLI